MARQVGEKVLIWGPREDEPLGPSGAWGQRTATCRWPSSQEVAVSGVPANVCPPRGRQSASSPAWVLWLLRPLTLLCL